MEKRNTNHDCCGGDHSNHGNHGGHGKHMIWMMLACMIPLALAFLFPQSRISRFLAPLMVLICPLSHLLMMGGVMKAFKKDPDDRASQTNAAE